MKKMILILFLLGSLVFGYKIESNGLYTFSGSEAESLFGPNVACQAAGMGMFNEGVIRYILRNTAKYEGALKASEKYINYIDKNLVRKNEDFDRYKDPYENVVGFQTQKCPKVYGKTAKSLFSKEEYRIFVKLRMTKMFKGKKTSKMDRYGNYYEYSCTETETTRTCGYERIEDI